MRTALPLLVMLLTATAAWAGLRVNGRDLPREQEVGIYCSVCMGVVFGLFLIVMLVLAILRRADRNRRDEDRKPPDFKGTAPPPGN